MTVDQFENDDQRIQDKLKQKTAEVNSRTFGAQK